MEKINSAPEQEYRDNLANEIIKTERRLRKKVLEAAKKTREYWEARFFKVSERRKGEGLDTREALSTTKLLQEYKERKLDQGKKLEFITGENKDVYNISSPIEVEGLQYIAGRIEDRKDWTNSQSGFFVEQDGKWILDSTKPIFDLEDPFILKIKDILAYLYLVNFMRKTKLIQI